MKTTKTLFITLICSFIFSLTTPSSIAFANHTLITSNVYAASTDATPPEISPACLRNLMDQCAEQISSKNMFPGRQPVNWNKSIAVLRFPVEFNSIIK